MSESKAPGHQLRKTRFVCISDTHNQTPKLPKGDVLIHAGDLSNQGSISELRKTVEWLEKADFEAKIVIAGNHDITLDSEFFAKHESSWKWPQPQSPAECRKLFTDSSSITYLNHESRTIYLRSPTAPPTYFTIFGSPHSPLVPNSTEWAFQYGEADAEQLWSAIPLDTDIVITHTPPKNHRDTGGRKGMSGCEALRKALWRVRPLMAVFGHIHEERGVERVRWNLDVARGEFEEESTKLWTDPGAGNNKQSLVDLTAKGRHPLDNDAAHTRRTASSLIPTPAELHSGGQMKPFTDPEVLLESALCDGGSVLRGSNACSPSRRMGSVGAQPDVGRTGRQETCMINAAIMSGGWGGRPKQLRKPVVVDIDLPVWISD